MQEIVIIAPEFAEDFAGASVAEVRAHAGGEQVRQARLITGVIDEGRTHLDSTAPQRGGVG